MVLTVQAVSGDILLDGVAARVNDRTITVADVLTAMEPVRRKLLDNFEGEALMERLDAAYDSALTLLVDRALILEAYEAQEQKIPEWAVDNRVNEILHDVFNDDREALLASLTRENLTFEEWREEVREHMVVAAMRAANVDQKVQVPPLAVRRAYEAGKDGFRTPERVKLRMIVLKKAGDPKAAEAKRQQAEALRRKLVEGQDFAMLARQVSEGSQASAGGDWGWIEPAKMLRRELAEAALELEPSSVSRVIETDEEIYILKSEGRKEASVTPFDEVRQQIEKRLRAQQKERLYDAWIEQLSGGARIERVDRDPFPSP